MTLICPKCKSTTVFVENDKLWNEEYPYILSCWTCGKRVYGAAVLALIGRKDKPSKTQVKPVKPPKPERPVMPTKPKRVSAFCAWKGCKKERRPQSKYCSRSCSNKNAHHQQKLRQGTKRRL